MRYAVLLGITVVGHDDGALHAHHLAEETSAQHPTRLVRIMDTHNDQLVGTYRHGVCIDDLGVQV
jgi:hypothetical protein